MKINKTYTLLLLVGLLITNTSLQAQQTIKIPKGNDITIDGVFTGNEWTTAYVKTITDSFKIYLQQTADYVLIGIQPPRYEQAGMIDIYLKANDKNPVNIYSSAEVGERQLFNYQWQEFKEWSNTIGWETDKMYPNYQIYEFRFHRSRFNLTKWKILFGIRNGDISYPAGAMTVNTEKWLILEL